MDTTPEKKNLDEARIIVNYDDPGTRPPPNFSVGPMAWIRENLFNSVFDTILTLVSGFIITSLVITMLGWSVREGNWLAVNQNWRNFMIGSYPDFATWRLFLVYYLIAFITGFSIATWARAGRGTLIAIGIFLAVLFAIPLIAAATLPAPKALLTAGNVSVESGTVTESPNSTNAFVVEAGDTVTISLPDSISDDESVAGLSGFGDRTVAAYISAAETRLNNIARIDEIERTLNADERQNGAILSDLQREELQSELESLSGANLDSVTEALAVNTAPTTVQIYEGSGSELTLLTEATLSAGDPALEYTVENDGWNVLLTSVEEEGVLSVLETTGIYPLLNREVSEFVYDEDGEPVLTSSDRIQTETVSEYARITDQFTITVDRPVLEGEEASLVQLTDNQYRGERPFSSYVTLHVVPLFNNLSFSTLFLAIVGIAGYAASRGVQSLLPSHSRGEGDFTNTMALGLWAGFAFLLFVLATGTEGLNGVLLGNLLGQFVWVGIMFFIGMNFERPFGRPLFGLGLVMILGHIMAPYILNGTEPLIAFTDDGLIGWGVSIGFWFELILWIIIGVFAFRNGVTSQGQLGESSQLRGLVGSLILWLALLIVTPLLIGGLAGGPITNYRSTELLPVARMNLWGGLFLTFMLTAVGIVASFPIGILLALGRRAHNYPIVKYSCILYIEFVRGVPLITVLFMATLLLPLANPDLATVETVIRAMVGITMFSAAYLAENVRGGLQSIPSGQEEAGKALGLSPVQVTTLITLPQALRAVIPALVGQFIALFKDTSLVFIVGLAELTGWATRVVAQPEFVGRRPETFLFISIVYFIFSYVMSYVSRRIEESGAGSARR